jgi:phosphatidylglycerophosphate synthase
MDHKVHISIFSQAEDSVYGRFQRMRDGFFEPVCSVLAKAGVQPDHLSYLNLVLAFIFVFFVQSNVYLSVAALLASLLTDALDGCLARYKKAENEGGALMDIAADHTFLFAAVLSLIHIKTVDGFWGAAFSLNYLLMIVLIMAMRAKNLHVFPVVRSKYYFYLAWLLFVFTGLNYLDILLVFFSIYMVLTNLFLFRNYRCSLS